MLLLLLLLLLLLFSQQQHRWTAIITSPRRQDERRRPRPRQLQLPLEATMMAGVHSETALMSVQCDAPLRVTANNKPESVTCREQAALLHINKEAARRQHPL